MSSTVITSLCKLLNSQKKTFRCYFSLEVRYEKTEAAICRGDKTIPNLSGLFLTPSSCPWPVHKHHRRVDIWDLSDSYGNDLETQADRAATI